MQVPFGWVDLSRQPVSLLAKESVMQAIYLGDTFDVDQFMEDVLDNCTLHMVVVGHVLFVRVRESTFAARMLGE